DEARPGLRRQGRPAGVGAAEMTGPRQWHLPFLNPRCNTPDLRRRGAVALPPVLAQRRLDGQRSKSPAPPGRRGRRGARAPAPPDFPPVHRTAAAIPRFYLTAAA